MNPKLQARFIIIRIIIDILLLPFVITLAYFLKFKIGLLFFNFFNIQILTIYQEAQIEPYLKSSGYVILIWITSFYYSGVYKFYKSILAEVDEILAIIKGTMIALVLIMALSYVVPIIPDSRFVLFYMGIIGIILFSIIHYFIYHLQLYFYKKNRRKVVIVGNTHYLQDVIESIVTNPNLGLVYIGSYYTNSSQSIHYTIKDQFKRLGDINALMNQIAAANIDVIFISDKMNDQIKERLIHACNQYSIEFNIIAEKYHNDSNAISGNEFAGISYVSFQQIKKWGFKRHIKHILDKVIAFIALIVLIPLFLMISIWIKWVSVNGPIVYQQKRVGQAGKVFSFYKFRTMKVNAEKETGPVFVNHLNENRYIKGGYFLRKYSLDELPQFFNVLKGDMSLVGPRPERPVFVNQYTQEISGYNIRHNVKGGLTGWAQINGRSELTRNILHKTKYDLHYIKNWNLILDIKIILKTIISVVKGENAY